MIDSVAKLAQFDGLIISSLLKEIKLYLLFG